MPSLQSIIDHFDRATSRERPQEPARAIRRTRRDKGRPGPRRRVWGQTSGLRGVYLQPSGLYQAKLRHGGRLYYLGSFGCAESAGNAVAAKLAELEGGAA